MNDDHSHESDKVGKRCPKCDGEMIQGFVLDQAPGSFQVPSWTPGAPASSFWFGTKIDRKNSIPIGSFCCSSCGFLESYAQRQFAAK